MRWIYGLILAAGCNNYMQLPGQDKAVDIVWRQTYGSTSEPNAIQWITQENLDCAADFKGKNHAFYRWRWYGDLGKSEHCVGGVTWPDWGLSQVALSDGDTFSNTAMAHELWHGRMLDVTGDGDPKHLDPGFGIGFGFGYGAVDLAQDNLRKEGL
jgi:hypothetical protein